MTEKKTFSIGKLVAVCIVALLFISFSETDKKVEIVFRLYEKSDTLEVPIEGEISIYAKGKLIISKMSSVTGSAAVITIPAGEKYQIFIRKEGYVTKMAELNAKVKNIDEAPDPLYLPFSVTLFKKDEGVDFAFLENTPMVKFYFDEQYYFRWDKEYTKSMLKKIEELKNGVAD